MQLNGSIEKSEMSDRVVASKRHLLTVALEDYFHVGAFNRTIQRRQWYRFEPRLERNTLKALELLDRHQIKATFFVLGWVADHCPEIVKEVAKRGHEIASRGYYHRSIRQMTPSEFREDLSRSREALERVSGAKVFGYRVAHEWFTPSDFWALDILSEEGYAYDSSIVPLFRSFRSEPWRRFAHRHCSRDRELWEFPLSTCRVLGNLVPIAGGNYFRQFPHTLVKRAVQHWHRTYDAPFVMYFHVWELDPEQPRINTASLATRIRHYRNLEKMSWVLEDYFATYRFVGVAEYLGLGAAVQTAPTPRAERDREIRPRLERYLASAGSTKSRTLPSSGLAGVRRVAVSIVVPCFNEEIILSYLANTLRSVEAALEKDYDIRFIFVDDGSADATYHTLRQTFDARPNSTVLRHERNRGVAAAILTGIRHADTEVVCSVDCDCTYDPHELGQMIPMLTDSVDMVTASPYHPDGHVRNVPSWRLLLSKTSSFLYRRVLRQKLFTYTSCFRVYRRSAVVGLSLEEDGFLGIAEMAGKLDFQGSKIAEYPTTLEVRMLGRSKMKVARNIIGHLRLLARLLAMRMTSGEVARKALVRGDVVLNAPRPSSYQSPSKHRGEQT